MSEQPPSKRLKQSNIFEALKKQASLKKGCDPQEQPQQSSTSEVNEGIPGEMFGSDDKVKQFQAFRNTVRDDASDTRETRVRTSPRKADRNKIIDAKAANTGSKVASTAEDDRCAPSTSKCVTDSDNLPDSQGSTATSGGNADGRQSPLLFDSDIEMLEDVPDLPSSSGPRNDRASCSLGTPLTELHTYPASLPPLGLLTATRHHTVLVKLPYKSGDKPEPNPKNFIDKWDGDHVRLPCSPENLYPVEGSTGGKSLKSRWNLIRDALGSDKMSSSLDLEEAILTYNTRYNQKWDFRGLHVFFTEVIEAEEAEAFFKVTLPKMVDLALQLPQLCTQPIPMLKKSSNHTVTMSHHQAASLLANAFFCTFPRRNSSKKQSEYSTYPDINFSPLFQGGTHRKAHRKAEKLKCIINYFRRVTREMPRGTITFRRQCIKELPKWNQSPATLRRLHVSATGTIEDDGLGMLQVDFANKYLGGGVLGYGCVQEEIRFLLCPELMLSRLFTEVLERNESLIMTGCETFSTYTGYADSFKWSGDFVDTTPRDPWGRRCTEIVAIDALVFRTFYDQFHENLVKREMNKAYCGFLTPGVRANHLSAVATGNWGCGAFGGDVRLKALLQLMAAAEAQRDVCYFTFQNFELMEELHRMHQFITSKDLAISDIFSLIQQYYDNVCVRSNRAKKPKLTLYEYIYQVYCGYDDTDSTDQAPDVGESDGEISPKMRATWDSKNSPDYAANTP